MIGAFISFPELDSLYGYVICENGCWEWIGPKVGRGYGNIVWRLPGKPRRYRHKVAHRVAYETMRGPIPDGLTLDHLCRNRGCVNPWHLEPVTSRENTLRGISPAAVNARLTHCKRGHPLSGDNLRLVQSPSGKRGRSCRTCAKIIGRKSYEAKRARAAAALSPQGRTDAT